jgi:hypothetical protein
VSSITHWNIKTLSLINIHESKFEVDYSDAVTHDIPNALIVSKGQIRNLVIRGPDNRFWRKDESFLSDCYPLLNEVKTIEVYSNFPLIHFQAMTSLEEVVWNIGSIPFATKRWLYTIVSIPKLKKLTLDFTSMHSAREIMVDITAVKDVLNEENIHLVLMTDTLPVDSIWFELYSGIKRLTIFMDYIGCISKEPREVLFADHDELTLHMAFLNPYVVITFQNVKHLYVHDTDRRCLADCLSFHNPTRMTVSADDEVIIE